jgi:hypothetical protein
MFVNKDVLERGRAPDALLVFLHCQRTGGKNFERWLKKAFKPEEVYDRRTPGFKQWNQLDDLSSLDTHRLFQGFGFYKDFRSKRPVLFLGNVRHPFYRIASLRRLAKNQPHHFLHDLIDKDLETFYEEGRSRNQSYFDNLQTHRLAGEIDTDKAIATIKKEFGVVGTTDTLFAASQMLIDAYGWTLPPLPPLDAPPDAERYASLAQQPVFKKICDNNEHDVAVFEFVNSFASGVKITRPPPKPAAKPRKTQSAGPRDFEYQDRAYYAQKQKDPSTSYAAFMMERVGRAVAKGAGHNSLGSNIVRPSGQREEFWEAGESKAHRYMKLFDIKGNERVCEYGCGSLRVGAHFIKRLPAGHFYGVDVVDTFFEIGKTLVGPNIMASKTPRLGVISPDEVKKVAEFQPDCTYSSSVCVHVHPDEFATYCGNLQSIANKPGARLFVEIHLADQPVRYAHRNWARPMSMFEAAMPELEIVQLHGVGQIERNGLAIRHGTLEWRRPQPRSGLLARMWKPKEAPPKAKVEAPAKRSSRADTPATVAVSSDPEKSYSTRVDPAFGFSRIAVTLSVPSLPAAAAQAAFTEHVRDPQTREPTDEVIGVFTGGAVVSKDLGASWDVVTVPELPTADFWSCFTLRSGERLLQIQAPAAGADEQLPPGGTVCVLDRNWKPIQSSRPGPSHWHGACSIDQSGDTIMYAEYPNNKKDLGKDAFRTSTVFRSRDGGRSWQKVFEKTVDEIRHFHTLVADPYVPGHWWLSSGDSPEGSRVWLSKDDGDTWIDASLAQPVLDLHPHSRNRTRSAFRYTDVWIGKDEMIWGADDWMGGSVNVNDPMIPYHQRAGSRMFRARKGDQLKPEMLGYVGNPVRSIIDIGPAFIVLTEAKRRFMQRPQVMLMSKADPTLMTEIFTVDTWSNAGTGFSYSRSSRKAKDGVFFSFRGRYDVINSPTRILRWKVDLF